jgi:hypothetical protein
VAGSFEHNNESLGPMKGGEFLGYVSDYYLLMKDSAMWNSVGLFGLVGLSVGLLH